MELTADRATLLHKEAAAYARVSLANLRREFPADVHHLMTKPGDFPFRPRARSPVFYGSLDWHSCVQMYWALVRLLRAAPGAVPAAEIRTALNAHLSAVGLVAEAEFIAGPDGLRERPYGWGAALALAEETALMTDPEGRRWAEAMVPLAKAVADRYLAWFPKATYPVRHGQHANSAFGLSRALPYARRLAEAGEPALLDGIAAKAHDWFGCDTMYPGGWEPSGQDFLSPALCEAELMAQLLPRGEFGGWLSMFLPGIAGGEPSPLFKPAVVSDSSDGQIAHLHGLNVSRAWCWRRIAESLPEDDPRVERAEAAAHLHTEVSLPHVVGDDYMVEHWLAYYAVLLLS